MAFTVGAIAAKDGAAGTITGGLLAADTVGGGAGPWFLYNGLVDGVAGVNKAAITAANALKVDGSAVTQPVSIASLPSGAVTNAGTFAVQNTAATPAGTNVIGHVIVDTAPTTAVTIATAPVLVAGAAIIGKVGIDQTTDGTTNAVHLVAGTAVAGKFGVDQTTDLTTNKVRAFIHDGTTAFKVLPASTNPSATDPAVIVAISPNGVNANIGTNADGVAAAATFAAPVGSFNLGFNGTTWDRVQVDSAKNLKVAPQISAAANGMTSSRVNAANSTNATPLKASAGNIGCIDVFNAAAYSVFLKLYNKASSPTVGTDTPTWTIPIAAGGGFAREFARGKTFSAGIAYAITKLQADSDTTVVAAGDLTGSIDWI